MCLAVGDGLTDSGSELETILDALADFLDEDAVAAELIAGVKEVVMSRSPMRKLMSLYHIA